jgi:hypothetical protein
MDKNYAETLIFSAGMIPSDIGRLSLKPSGWKVEKRNRSTGHKHMAYVRQQRRKANRK